MTVNDFVNTPTSKYIYGVEYYNRNRTLKTKCWFSDARDRWDFVIRNQQEWNEYKFEIFPN